MPARFEGGQARMRALATETPTAFLQGFSNGQGVELASSNGGPRVLAVGMGASGIVGDLARAVVEAETSAAMSVLRGFELPRSLSARDHVLLTSYSGNTWETLRAYDAAGRTAAHRIAVTSGGELADRAEADGVPVLRVPPGLPPRSAVGHLLGGILGILDPVFPESNDGRAHRAADEVRAAMAQLLGPSGTPARLAKTLGARLPFVYAESAFLPLARRWKTQIEENAKRLAVFDEVTELFHNAVVGWDAARAPDTGRVAVIGLEWVQQDPRVRASFRYLESMLRRRKVPFRTVPLEQEDRLAALLAGIVTGDLLSLELALRRRVDPMPVEAITRMKARLGPGLTGR